MLRREFLFLAGLPAVTTIPIGSSLRLVAQNRYFAKPGKAVDVYKLRLHACDVLQRIGVAPGVVFRCRGGNEPDAVWQVEFATRDEAREARRKVSISPEFTAVQDRMGELIRRFETSLYQELIPTSVDDKSPRSRADCEAVHLRSVGSEGPRRARCRTHEMCADRRR